MQNAKSIIEMTNFKRKNFIQIENEKKNSLKGK